MLKKIRYYWILSQVAIYTLYYSIRILILMKLKGKEVFYPEGIRWGSKFAKIAGITIVVTGEEMLDPAQSYIYASNHSSLFDIPVLLAALKDKVRFIYKKELEKIPVFGNQLKMSPYIAVERSDPRKSMKSIEEAVTAIENGVSVIIFPEGTRSLTGELGEFKRGAFLLASKAKKGIVPVTVVGSSDIMPAGTYNFNPGIVEVIIGKPIENPGNLSKVEEKQLMTELHEILQKNLTESKKRKKT